MNEHRSRRCRHIGIHHLQRGQALRPALVFPPSFAVASASVGSRTTRNWGSEKRRRHQHGRRHVHLARLGARSSAGPPSRTSGRSTRSRPTWKRVATMLFQRRFLACLGKHHVVHVMIVWRLADAREHGKNGQAAKATCSRASTTNASASRCSRPPARSSVTSPGAPPTRNAAATAPSTASSTRGATSRTTSRRSAWRRSTRTPRTSPTASSASSSAR